MAWGSDVVHQGTHINSGAPPRSIPAAPETDLKSGCPAESWLPARTLILAGSAGKQEEELHAADDDGQAGENDDDLG